MKLSLFCANTGLSKKDFPLWSDVYDALHQLRTNTGSVNIVDVDNQKTLSIHSDGMHFLLSLIEGRLWCIACNGAVNASGKNKHQ